MRRLATIAAACLLTACAAQPKPDDVHCRVPPMPVNLPDPPVSAIYEGVGTDVAEMLLERERRIVDALFEHRAIVKAVCE